MEQPQEDPKRINISGNHYATAYTSRGTHESWSPAELNVMQHMNCSYLSSGRPPTLLALKQHAHSLTNLILRLSIATTSAAVTKLGCAGRDGWGFGEHSAFDWLDNLQIPYDNKDESHHRPLPSISNCIEKDSEDKGPQQHCPLTEVQDSDPGSQKGGTQRPYYTHHNLVMHANECLEILDHEYSSTGGLISILPTNMEHDTVELTSARNSLLGQWLLHSQHLVGRMHELEINYANALDVVEGEAMVPLQAIRRAGTDGVSQGRQIAYPQDRYVLVNAGDDVTSFLHRQLDRTEAQVDQKEQFWKISGVSGERMWHEKRGGKWYARGIIPVDLLTRFYRVAGKGHASPIFIMPAIEQHPGVAATRHIEQHPTVVSIATPTWPKRVSDWDRKFKERLERAKELELENQRLVRENMKLQATVAFHNEDRRGAAGEEDSQEAALPKGDEKGQQALLRRIAAYEAKMDALKKTLPSKYHSQLALTVEEEGQE
ncbi:hypothetical protein BKA56DRAFT_717343 [Ilyonectria sp. MPI-CAGE-AT-0026]|nr:hypothetical protein BKA56DRAFT_717343 [Ilyonectria sp. MPI-CAGE-AT-0026]